MPEGVHSVRFGDLTWVPWGDKRGAGGGGGGGSVTILALGTIQVGPHGQVCARGGTGGEVRTRTTSTASAADPVAARGDT